MKKKINQILVGAIPRTLFGLGLILAISPFILYWWIHGSYERYLWIISGPPPYSNLGGAPYQLFLYCGLFIAGILLIIIAFVLKKFLSRRRNKEIPQNE